MKFIRESITVLRILNPRDIQYTKLLCTLPVWIFMNITHVCINKCALLFFMSDSNVRVRMCGLRVHENLQGEQQATLMGERTVWATMQ